MKPITRQQGEEVEQMIRRFKRSVQKEGIIEDYRKRTAYMKPGERRRQKHLAAVTAEAKRRKWSMRCNNEY